MSVGAECQRCVRRKGALTLLLASAEQSYKKGSMDEADQIADGQASQAASIASALDMVEHAHVAAVRHLSPHPLPPYWARLRPGA